jgi:hypothetical protein
MCHFRVIPGSQRREVGGYSFFVVFVFSIRLMRFGDLEILEEKHSPVG